MADVFYGRLRDLGGLPELLAHLAGQEGLERAFRDQDMPIELLSNPDAPVPMRDLVGLYHRASIVSAMRSFGLQASQEIDFEKHGLAAEYVMQALDLTRGLQRFCAALPFHETGSSLDVEAEGDELRIGYRNVYQRIHGWRHAGDFTLCAIGGVISSYLGSDWQPLRIETCYIEGPWEQDIEDFFGAPVRFGKDWIAIVLDRDAVRQSVQRRTPEPGRIVTLADLRRMNEALPKDLPHAVVNVIERRLVGGQTDIESVAATLEMGPRTLQRRLSDHGVNYRDLVLHSRMRRARDLLAEPDVSVLEISRELGYNDTPQFSRAFKAFFDATPQEFRKLATDPR